MLGRPVVVDPQVHVDRFLGGQGADGLVAAPFGRRWAHAHRWDIVLTVVYTGEHFVVDIFAG